MALLKTLIQNRVFFLSKKCEDLEIWLMSSIIVRKKQKSAVMSLDKIGITCNFMSWN